MSEQPERDPDICERCGLNPATVHVRRVKEGEEEDLHLCLSCAQEEGVEPAPADTGLSPDPLTLLFKNMGETAGEGGVCPGCGLSFGRFRETGRLGCWRCYETFTTELEPMIRRIHGATRHRGKHPRREGENYEQGARLRRLSEELERAVGAEDYERAAEIRDRIREMEAAGRGGGSAKA